MAPSITVSAPWAGPPRPPSWACSLHPPLQCACSLGLAPSPAICSSGQAPLLRGSDCSHIPGSLFCPGPCPEIHPQDLPASPAPQPGRPKPTTLPLQPAPHIPLPLRMASPATPAPELELGIIQRTVILHTSLSPPHGIGHQLLWLLSSERIPAHPPVSPHWRHHGEDLAPFSDACSCPLTYSSIPPPPARWGSWTTPAQKPCMAPIALR